MDCECGMILDAHEEECPNCHRENVDGVMLYALSDEDWLSESEVDELMGGESEYFD